MNMKKIFTIAIIIITILIGSFMLFVGIGLYQNNKLFKAIEKNNYDAAKTAIENGAWINTRKYLINISEIVSTNPTPLIAACKSGDEKIVKLLINNGADINKVDNFTGKTPLLSALHGNKENRFALAIYLIESGADIHIIQETTSAFKESITIMDTDTSKTIEEGFELFKYLLSNGADVNISNGQYNALTFAAYYNNYQVVEYLIKNNLIDINDVGKNGNTALIEAAKENNAKIVELLLSLGADKSIIGNNNKSAYDYAVENDNDEIIHMLR